MQDYLAEAVLLRQGRLVSLRSEAMLPYFSMLEFVIGTMISEGWAQWGWIGQVGWVWWWSQRKNNPVLPKRYL